MNKVLLLALPAIFLTGCPDDDPMTDMGVRWDSPPQECINEFQPAVFEVGLADGHNEKEVCDEALLIMSEQGSEDWLTWHNAVWDLADNIPACRGNDGSSEIHRYTLLRDREIMRIRCKANCEGRDPEACNWP